MKCTRLEMPDVIVIDPAIYEDDRGWFYESFNQSMFNEMVGEKVTFVQDNHSFSRKGVLRGLHYQESPHGQGKLVRVIKGEVFDVAVDVRKDSVTYGKWVSQILSAENRKQMWIPEGFAHGFLSISNEVEFTYKTTSFYCASADRCILWNDKKLNIDWPLNNTSPILSIKDQNGVRFN